MIAARNASPVPATPLRNPRSGRHCGGAGGSEIQLSLKPDTKFTWKYTHQGKTDEFSGGYKLADNLLILEQEGGAPMVGQVTLAAGNRMNFKLAGGSSGDPGLTFTR